MGKAEAWAGHRRLAHASGRRPTRPCAGKRRAACRTAGGKPRCPSEARNHRRAVSRTRATARPVTWRLLPAGTPPHQAQRSAKPTPRHAEVPTSPVGGRKAGVSEQTQTVLVASAPRPGSSGHKAPLENAPQVPVSAAPRPVRRWSGERAVEGEGEGEGGHTRELLAPLHRRATTRLTLQVHQRR